MEQFRDLNRCIYRTRSQNKVDMWSSAHEWANFFWSASENGL